MKNGENSVLDGKLTDEQLGKLQRKLREIEKRINVQALDYQDVVDMMQYIIIENKLPLHLGVVKGTHKISVIDQKSILINLLPTEKILLDTVDGSKTIADSKNVFGFIDADFKKWNANDKGEKTEATEVKVLEMAKDANFAKMFGSLNPNPEALCLTQHQILNFVENHRRLLRKDGCATFFVFKSGNRFFVANLYFGVFSLEVRVHRFELAFVWSASDRHHVVVPVTGIIVV